MARNNNKGLRSIRDNRKSKKINPNKWTERVMSELKTAKEGGKNES
ncbi:hypothetical protein ACQCVB_17730 [Fictibacillus phosphorivorans]